MNFNDKYLPIHICATVGPGPAYEFTRSAKTILVEEHKEASEYFLMFLGINSGLH